MRKHFQKPPRQEVDRADHKITIDMTTINTIHVVPKNIIFKQIYKVSNLV